jgi:hypothetical protein
VAVVTALNSPAAIEAEIQRLYQQTRALPKAERLAEDGRCRRGARSPAYLALETQIRTLADRYAALLAQAS